MKLNAWLFIPNYHLTKDRVLVTGQKPDFLITDELSLEFIEYWTNARIHVHRGLLDFKNEIEHIALISNCSTYFLYTNLDKTGVTFWCSLLKGDTLIAA